MDASAANVPKTSSVVVASDERVFVGVACVRVFGGVIPLYVHTTCTSRSETFKSGTLSKKVIVAQRGPQWIVDRVWGSI